MLKTSTHPLVTEKSRPDAAIKFCEYIDSYVLTSSGDGLNVADGGMGIDGTPSAKSGSCTNAAVCSSPNWAAMRSAVSLALFKLLWYIPTSLLP